MSDRVAFGQMIRAAKKVVAFTGAGISTESGEPDFRSPGGVWSRMRPIPFHDFVTSEASRRESWGRVFSGAAGWTGAKPNSGHFALTHWLLTGKVVAIITQNVDNLHQDSGAPPERVIEIHGNAGFAACLDCQARHELQDLRSAFLERGHIPTCRSCGGLVKTATISFGQPVPPAVLARAEAAASDCDLFLVLGSSLKVYPAASLPRLAMRSGAALVIINRDPTDLDVLADLVLHDELGQALAAVGAP